MQRRYKRKPSVLFMAALLAAITPHATAKGKAEDKIPSTPIVKVPSPGGEPAPGTLTLQQALDFAARNNPAVIQSLRRGQEKTRALALTNGMPPPEFGVMFDDIPAGKINPLEGMMTEFTVSQEIMAPPKLAAMRAMAKSEAGMADADYEDRRLAVLAAVKGAYYDLLYAERSLGIMKENQELMEHLGSIGQTNYAHGGSPVQETLRAQTEIARMAVEIQNMTAMTEAARNKLNYLLGRPAHSPLAIAEEFSDTPPDYDFSALREEARNSPAVRGMTWELEMARNNVSMAKSELWPDFKLSFGWARSKAMDPMLMPMENMNAKAHGPLMAEYPVMGVNDYSLEMREITNNSWNIGFMVMLPLWFGGYNAKIRSANAGVEAARAGLEEMQNMTDMELSMALSEAQSAWRLIGLYQNTVIPQAETAYRANMVDYANGKTSLMAALDSLITLRGARLAYYRARVDYEKALAYLERTAGKPPGETLAALSKRGSAD